MTWALAGLSNLVIKIQVADFESCCGITRVSFRHSLSLFVSARRQTIHDCAIDGPSGAGKSTVSKSVAKAQHNCLDTGAMYRSIAHGMRSSMVSRSRILPLGEIARERAISFSHGRNPAPKQAIDGVDVTGDIRTARIDRPVSSASSTRGARALKIDQQHPHWLARSDYVSRGRDIGAVVFPQAEVRCSSPQSNERTRWRRRVAQNRNQWRWSVDFDECSPNIREAR